MDDFISRLVVRGSNLERATETRYTWKVETFVAVTTTYEWDALPQYSLTLEQTLDGVTDFSNYFSEKFLSSNREGFEERLYTQPWKFISHYHLER